MIYDTIENAGLYSGISKNLHTAISFMMQEDMSKYDTGRIEIDEDKVYAVFQEYETKPTNDRPEAHRKYIDIQYLLQGEELVGVAPLSSMVTETESRAEDDIYFYCGSTEKLLLGNRRFMILFPGDAHAPCIANGAPAGVKKLLIKVAVE